MLAVVQSSGSIPRTLRSVPFMKLRLPILIALTMTDTAKHHGVFVEAETLQRELGVPVQVVIASKRAGMEALTEAMQTLPTQAPPCARVEPWP